MTTYTYINIRRSDLMEKKYGVWEVTVRDKSPAPRQEIEEAMKRAGCRKPNKKPIKYIK